MEWDEQAVMAAAEAIKRVGILVDTIAIKSGQIESLASVLMATAEAPRDHMDNAYALVADLARSITEAASELGMR